ncbi:hypothetical protein PQX77_011552 [Marasmius sp. AFHP31]|nr:hypothetical protein PQX77_011552 [Marasmius sp. AFHP31]
MSPYGLQFCDGDLRRNANLRYPKPAPSRPLPPPPVHLMGLTYPAADAVHPRASVPSRPLTHRVHAHSTAEERDPLSFSLMNVMGLSQGGGKGRGYGRNKGKKGSSGRKRRAWRNTLNRGNMVKFADEVGTRPPTPIPTPAMTLTHSRNPTTEIRISSVGSGLVWLGGGGSASDAIEDDMDGLYDPLYD